MSVQKHRESWQVRWRDDQGRHRAQAFKLKRDADAFEAKVRLAKRAGIVDDLDAGRIKFSTFTAEWWKLHGNALAPKTQQVYKSLLKNHLTPRLGGTELRRINTKRVSALQAEMLAAGRGQETTRKTVALLQGMLERAVEWGRLPYNPARSVKKPTQKPGRKGALIAPATVEKIRASMLSRGLLRDATIVSLLAYAGLRPGEALALTWGDVGAKSLSVTKSISLGTTKDTKTGVDRTMILFRPLAKDLEAWREYSEYPAPDRLLFPRKDGLPWTDSDYRNWRTRHYVPRAKEAGIEKPRPYDLRHAAASLLFVEHRNPLEIARMMGHSTDVLYRTYGRVIPELQGSRKRSATTIIEAARRARESN